MPGFDFVRWMKSIESKISFILERLNNVLANTGLSVPAPGVTQVDGSLVVQNGEAKSGNYAAGSAGWHLDHAGNAEFNDLTIRGGIIGNDALTNPVVPGVVNLYASFFGLGTGAYAEVTGQDLTVPAGCTQLLFDGSAALDCYNPKTTGGNNGAGGDYLYARVKIGSLTSPGDWATGVSGGGGNATATAGYAALITGLTPGSTIRASVYGVSDYGIASASGNIARLNATLIWLR
jgi:hypothetical protein